MENSEKLILISIILLSISVSAYSITQKHFLTLDSYQELLLAKDYLMGKSTGTVPLLYQLTAAIYRMLGGMTDVFDESLFSSIARVLPVILSLICAVSVYFMLRGISKLAAFAGAVLLISSPAFFLSMSSGVYYADSLGMCAFVLAFSLLFLFYERRNYLFLVLSAAFFVLSSMNWNVGWLMGIGVLLSLLVHAACRRKDVDNPFIHSGIALLAAVLLGYFLAPGAVTFSNMSIDNLRVYAADLPLAGIGIAALAAVLAGRHKSSSRFEFFLTAFFVFSLALSLFDIFPASLGIVLFCAFAANELLSLKNENATIGLFSLVLFFSSFVFTQSFMDLGQSILASLLVGGTALFIASLYKERRVAKYVAFSVIALSLFSSINVAALISSQRVDRTGVDVDSMMVWVEESLGDNATIWAFQLSPIIEYTTGKSAYANDTEFASFMLSNESAASLRAMNITHIVVDMSLFDNLAQLKNITNNSRVRIDSFRIYRYERDNQSNVYAVFISSEGKAAWVPADPSTGNLIESDVQMAAPGESGVVISFKKFLRVGNYRLIYPEDNYGVNLFNIFFENAAGFKQVYASDDGEMKVYQVVG